MPTTPSGLVVPISREERMRAINARREKMESNLQTPQSEALERELRNLDDRLRVVFVDPVVGQLPPAMRGPGIIPGRWHIKILTHPRNEYFSLTGPDWEYREPELAVVEEMKDRDLWRRGALEQIRKDEEAEAARLHRQQTTESEARTETVAAAYRAAKRVPGDGGEKRNFAAKRRGEGLSKGGVVLPAGAKG